MGGLGGGHYTAYAKNYGDGKWYEFNDSWAGSVDHGKLCCFMCFVLE